MKQIALLIGSMLVVNGCHKLQKRVDERRTIRASYLNQCPLPPIGKPITIYVHGATPFGFIPGLYSSIHYPRNIALASTLSTKYTYGKVARMLNQVAPEKFPLDSFYLFGWEGTLSFKTRRRAACRLYHFIRNLRSNELYKDTPITVLAFSHGGNVSLNLAHAADYHEDAEFSVDQLILLACPVQMATSKFISSHTFKQVYAFNSKGDAVQVLDPQGLYPMGLRGSQCPAIFSQRLFQRSPQLLQSEVKIDGKQLGHFDFITERFLRFLPEAIEALQNPETRRNLPRVKNRYDHYCMDMNTKKNIIEPCLCKNRHKKKCNLCRGVHHNQPCRF